MKSRLPRSRVDFLLAARVERLAAELAAVSAALRGEEGDLWDWAGDHAALVCAVWSRAATVECLGFDPADPGS